MFDLLSSNATSKKKNFIKHDLEDLGIQNLMRIIEEKRIKADTGINCKSSRSHLLIKIFVNNSVICLVDLAGSERIRNIIDSGNGTIINETCSINKSLLVLGRCIRSLID